MWVAGWSYGAPKGCISEAPKKLETTLQQILLDINIHEENSGSALDEDVADLDLLDIVLRDFTGCETDLEAPVGGSDEAAVKERGSTVVCKR